MKHGDRFGQGADHPRDLAIGVGTKPCAGVLEVLIVSAGQVRWRSPVHRRWRRNALGRRAGGARGRLIYVGFKERDLQARTGLAEAPER